MTLTARNIRDYERAKAKVFNTRTTGRKLSDLRATMVGAQGGLGFVVETSTGFDLVVVGIHGHRTLITGFHHYSDVLEAIEDVYMPGAQKV